MLWQIEIHPFRPDHCLLKGWLFPWMISCAGRLHIERYTCGPESLLYFHGSLSASLSFIPAALLVECRSVATLALLLSADGAAPGEYLGFGFKAGSCMIWGTSCRCECAPRNALATTSKWHLMHFNVFTLFMPLREPCRPAHQMPLMHRQENECFHLRCVRKPATVSTPCHPPADRQKILYLCNLNNLEVHSLHFSSAWASVMHCAFPPPLTTRPLYHLEKTLERWMKWKWKINILPVTLDGTPEGYPVTR